MLELRPTCEHCNTPLRPNSTEAMICTFECTFCKSCVENIIHNVCPNCGGGFTPRPIRPYTAWVPKVSLSQYPATTKVTHKLVNQEEHSMLVSTVAAIPPEER
ncbi:MAG: DUF1272 domain-containing protein [Armatimonadota bacterium]